jgi:sialidase-1
LATWFRNDSNAPNQAIAFNGVDGAGWGLALDGSGNMAALYSGVNWLSTSVQPAIGKWHHAALVRSTGATTIYLDGVAYTPTNSMNAPITPGAGFAVGRQSAATGRYFDGAIDEVAVYALVLGSGTIANHFAAGRPTDSLTAVTTGTSFDVLGRATDTMDPTGTVTHSARDRLGRTIGLPTTPSAR